MDELNIVLHQFQIDLRNFINDEVRRQVSAMVREIPAEAPAVVHEERKRGPEKGTKAQAKPCPVTGVLNTHRRFSYLMPEVRTPENLKKFKRGGK